MTTTSEVNHEILVLPSWYPSAQYPFAGDFVQRHIEAIALFQKQYVLHVVKDKEGSVTRDVKSVLLHKKNYREEVVYYHPRRTGIGFIDKFLSDRKYYKVYKRAVKNYIAENHQPLFTHVHIAMKAGVVAAWMKKKYNIPFLLTEHWTGYLPEADLRLEHHNPIFLQRTKNVITHADKITVVSGHLANAMQQRFPSKTFTVIPNVVDTGVFYAIGRTQNPVPQFIHASTFGFQKNIDDILKALEIVKEKKYAFRLTLFGPATPALKEKVKGMDLSREIIFKGEVAQAQLAAAMQQADALILYSRFETFGCVIIEANAAGIPVMVSDIPVFHELVRENENGFFVSGENPEKLAETLIRFIEQRDQVRNMPVTKKTGEYTFEQVGSKFRELFKAFIPR